MKKYILMFGLTLVMGLFVSNTIYSQSNWTPGVWQPGDINRNGDVNIGSFTGYSGLGGQAAEKPLLHVRNATGVTDLRLSRPLTGNGPVGRFRIINETTGDIMNFVLRRATGGTEMIQSAYDGVNAQWREYAYLNVTTGQYIVRPGILNWTFRNNGDVLFYNAEGAGAVGIGYLTMPTGAKLAVNGDFIADGKITSKEVEVKLDVWPDFVFSSDYYLRPLSEVEQFISTHNHLPGVPSEAEVLQNGVNVGEMTSTLLLKIEELTLYIIELNKRIEELEK